jgi:hypothetical protein
MIEPTGLFDNTLFRELSVVQFKHWFEAHYDMTNSSDVSKVLFDNEVGYYYAVKIENRIVRCVHNDD